jgi:hypothetical protein
VGSGYLFNERETKGRSDFMSHKDVQLPSYFNPSSFQRKRKEISCWEEKISFSLLGFKV